MAATTATTTATNSVPTQGKRKSSAAGLATGGRTVKRRASKACHCCRSRKVRCDVVESGIPCTNCRLDEVECIVTEGKRRRKSYVDGELFHHSPCNSIEEEKEPPQFPIFDDIDELNTFVPTLPSAEPAQPLQVLEDELIHHKPHMLCKSPPASMLEALLIRPFFSRPDTRTPSQPGGANSKNVCYQQQTPHTSSYHDP